jgi:hypothetical protein
VSVRLADCLSCRQKMAVGAKEGGQVSS